LSKPTQKSLFESEARSPEPAPWERAAETDRLTAQVVFNRPLDITFDYLVPDELRPVMAPGQRVRAPFGQGDQLTVGYCVGLEASTPTSRRLKTIHSILDREPLLSSNMLELTAWIADRYLCGWGQVLDIAIPAGVKRRAGTRLITFVRPAVDVHAVLIGMKLPKKQQAVMELLCSTGELIRLDQLTETVGCGTAPINALKQKGLIQTVRRRTSCSNAEVGQVTVESDLQLNRDQQIALDSILTAIQSGQHQTLLLHGVTGSGKTEVYIQAIREVVSYGRQAIVLVPEISLTPQTTRRFRSRFESVAVLHSHLSNSERHWHWQQIAQGGVQVVVGARSAVFAPTSHLGLIVIDEEHETTFKQETTPRYHAREVARQRAQIENIPLVLGSATPTLESWLRVQQCQDQLLSLPKRVEQRPLPPVSIVDVRNDGHCRRGGAIGLALHTAMRMALDDGGQIILFLNLRGFSPTVWCRFCGQGAKCPECDITLTFHKDRQVVLCHFCDYQSDPPSQCPACGQPGVLYLGIGTQRLEKEVQASFPNHRCLRMDSDTMRQPGSHDKALESFRHGDVSILLGTQMIAKGLDFPNVTLVGVINADVLLHQPDLRAAERTFQLIAQVAGRTGRGTRGGRVIVQTACPSEPAIILAAKHDYDGFANWEMENRRAVSAPPFQHLTRVILRGTDEQQVKSDALKMAEVLRKTAEAGGAPVRILGPAPAPVIKKKNKYRYHFQLTAECFQDIQQLWRQVLDQVPRSREVENVVDVDAINLR